MPDLPTSRLSSLSRRRLSLRYALGAAGHRPRGWCSRGLSTHLDGSASPLVCRFHCWSKAESAAFFFNAARWWCGADVKWVAADGRHYHQGRRCACCSERPERPVAVGHGQNHLSDHRCAPDHPPPRPASRARLATLPAGHPRQSARPRRVSHPLILHPRAHSSLVHRPDYLRCRLAACACPQAAECLKLASLSSFSSSRFLANGAGITSPH